VDETIFFPLPLGEGIGGGKVQGVRISKGGIMDDFPKFMRNPKNRIHSESHYVKGLEGFVFDGADGGQVILWSCRDAGVAEEHSHPFDEYIVTVQGEYILHMGGKAISLKPGQECLVPKGTKHYGERVVGGTRTIHAFGGKRAVRETEFKG
jgi:quercetin dioxygenase-like cupin family protein